MNESFHNHEILLLKFLIDREINMSLSLAENENVPEEFRSAANDYSLNQLQVLRDKLEEWARLTH